MNSGIITRYRPFYYYGGSCASLKKNASCLPEKKYCCNTHFFPLCPSINFEENKLHIDTKAKTKSVRTINPRPLLRLKKNG